MTGSDDRDVAARLAEIEATVRGLTQELVSAEERIRQLEAALDDAPDDAPTVDGATKATPGDAETPTEPPAEEGDDGAADLDDIIVA